MLFKSLRKLVSPPNDKQLLQAAYRILRRGPVDPEHHAQDPRYVLWCACSHVAKLTAWSPGEKGSIHKAGQIVGEDPDTLAHLLDAAGYDLNRLTQEDRVERSQYALQATEELFADVIEKYGADREGTE